MKSIKNILVIGCICVLGGCASTSMKHRDLCVVATIAAGSAIGTVVGNGPGAVAGFAGGAATAAVLCGKGTTKSAPVAKSTPDSDGDGVSDDKDACPNTPAGVAVDSRGCPRDDDGDGVANYQDKCPGTPRGVAVDDRGCQLDDDKDGVVNNLDECPGTPAGVKVNSKGCPEVGETVLVLYDINFAFNSAVLDASSQKTLDEKVQLIKQQNVKLDIVGHTDSTGPAAYNQALSERRAKAVRAYLISAGIDASRLTASGKGESSPIASNKTREGRAKNRRVEFVVTR